MHIFDNLYYTILFFLFVLVGAVMFVVLFFITAPYGKHVRKGWGPGIDKRAGWIIMEAISPATFVIFFFLGNWKEGIMVYGFLFLWLLHYLYRSFIFSSIQRGRRNMPLVVMAFGMLFNLANGYLQGKYLFSLSPGLEKYSAAWLATPQFIVGVILFLAGFIIHIHSDSIIRNLRTQGEDNEYKIPRGGLFRVLSAPNYFGEIVEWTGWAVLTWSLPGAAFAFWTAANLLPRGVANHKWYKKTFPDYPQERKAILPFIL